MGSAVRRLAVAIGAAGVGVLLSSSAAEAKILPVDSVAVVTAHPKAGHPVDVVVSFGENFDLGDFAWENGEVSVLPAARTDVNGWPLDRTITDVDGWPLDRTIAAIPVKLHRVSKGVYRGSFIVTQPGEYVVVDWSSFYAKEDRARGVVMTRSYAAPIRVRIYAAMQAHAPSVSGSTSHDHLTLGGAVLIGCVAMAAGVAAICLRRRRARRIVEIPPSHGGDRILVGSGSRQN
jgi:hypothetical protein